MIDVANVRAAAARLTSAGIDDGLREARILAKAAPDAATFAAFIARRERREPVAYILGRREFWSLEFEVTPAVLIPRPDTETIVETALRELTQTPPRRILDLGTGSGCLLISLLTEFPRATGVGIDISPEAIEVAKRNAARLGVADRATFELADFGAFACEERFDLVVSNPPYIPDATIVALDPDVRDHEPQLALKGGRTGLDAVERIACALARTLAPEGLALIEIGHDQGESGARTLRNEGVNVLEIVKDLAGLDRVLVARLPHPTDR
jgi:release factor glutamine methyltransferase